jgi:acyl-CoA thioesterase-1
VNKTLFTGDSITDSGRRTDPSGFLGAGFVRRIDEMGKERSVELHSVNRGVSGDRIADLRARWGIDVLDEQPTLLTIMIGINDTWRRFDSSDPVSTESFSSDFDWLLSTATSSGIMNIIVMSPFLVPVNDGQKTWHQEDLDAKISVARDAAERYGSSYIDLDGLFRRAASRIGAARITEDGVHPSALGHQLIADAWWESDPLQK